jgi:NitT/TauT family transport system substrate-binding protein
MPLKQTRRRFLRTLSLASAGGLLRVPRAFAAEPPPETTTLRLMRIPAICWAPQYVADELLRAEGFTDIRYLEATSSAAVNEMVAHGDADFSQHFASQWVSAIDRLGAVTVLAGVHVGCFGLFGSDRVHSVLDLKGKTVAVEELGSSEHLFASVIVAYIGLDPARDVNWVTGRSLDSYELFAQGKVDACLGFPPAFQDLRARHIGHLIVDSSMDPPWSQYFCCMLAGNREFVRDYPVATKRVIRAFLKAADLCASAPERAARRLVVGRFTPRYDYAYQTMRDVPYDKWREYDPEDAMRFWALRLHDVGIIKSSPQKIIDEGTDFSFFSELKRELKA